jgi:hypothetical protein
VNEPRLDRKSAGSSGALPTGNPWLAAFLIVAGPLLLIPALIAILVGVALPPETATDSALALLWLIKFAAGGSGIYLITRARRLAGFPVLRRNRA